MKHSEAPTLSAHLLTEANKFLLYPSRLYRTKKNLKMQAFVDERLRQLVQWRTTFSPQSLDMFVGPLGPVLLDELYCRDLLRGVPALVERTAKLAPLTLSGVSGESLIYLREASTC